MAIYLRDCLSSIEVLGCSVNWLCERLVPDICSTQILLLPASEIHELQLTSAVHSRNEHTSWERIRTVNNAQIHFKLLNTRLYFTRCSQFSQLVDNAVSSKQLPVACDSISSDLK